MNSSDLAVDRVHVAMYLQSTCMHNTFALIQMTFAGYYQIDEVLPCSLLILLQLPTKALLTLLGPQETMLDLTLPCILRLWLWYACGQQMPYNPI
jgi:hypothetical protein